MMFVDAVRLLLFPATMAFAASTDLLTMTISNRVSIILAVGFVLLAALQGMPLVDVGSHFAAALLVLAVGFVFFWRGWIGGGDAKLAAATALWLGWEHLYEYLLDASLLGGRPDACSSSSFASGRCRRCSPSRAVGGAAPRTGRRRALWHRPRHRRAPRLPLDGVDAGAADVRFAVRSPDLPAEASMRFACAHSMSSPAPAGGRKPCPIG